MASVSDTSVVVPVWNGRGWLEACLGAIAAQTVSPLEVIAVDNGSNDGSFEYLQTAHPAVRTIALPHNTGFAHAVNRGIAVARGRYVATLNTDVVLAPDWLERAQAALIAHPDAAAVATKIVDLADPGRIYDAGNVLRRDGACEQRGRFSRDDGRFDTPGWVFGACAGAAVYRREALGAVGGFDERYFAYLEDADLAVRLGRAGWRCRYEPAAVARHAGEGSSRHLPGGARRLVARNTLLLAATWFSPRWLPLAAYRQLGWLRDAARAGVLPAHLRGLRDGFRVATPVVMRRLAARRPTSPRLAEIIPAQPIRGPRALGHPAQRAR